MRNHDFALERDRRNLELLLVTTGAVRVWQWLKLQICGSLKYNKFTILFANSPDVNNFELINIYFFYLQVTRCLFMGNYW